MANIENHGTGYIYGLAVRLLPMLLPVLLLASCNGRGEHVVLLDRADSPSALDFYDKASSCADTLSRDCDFLLLMKVHSQKALLLENNLSPQLIADECLAASRFALKARDTLSANGCSYYLFRSNCSCLYYRCWNSLFCW